MTGGGREAGEGGGKKEKKRFSLAHPLFISDTDEEEEGPDWVVRTRQQIADAQPHDDEFWNCATCQKQVLGTTFVSYPANAESGAPAVRVHIFECALAFRVQWSMVWTWEESPGVPKAGFNADGTKIGSLEDSNMATRRKKEKKGLRRR